MCKKISVRGALFSLAIIVLVAGGVFAVRIVLLISRPAIIHHIVLAENGFTPQNIIIARGDTVVFSTSRGKQFWPASDLHPTHEIYPEFDPKRPVLANESWTFRFNRAGTWNFHDHLDPFFRGTIQVTDNSGTGIKSMMQGFNPWNSDAGPAAERNNPALPDRSCMEYADLGERLWCWQRLIQEKLRVKDLDGAFATLDAFTKQNPSELGSCHGLTHELGKQAYLLFNEQKDFALSPKTSYCGYGFYHGFMETLVHTTNDMAQARAFCQYADARLKYFIADAGSACFHGIGHGSVDDTPDPALWGDARAILAPALRLCERVSSDQYQLFRCASGAFNALEIISDQGRYNLSPNQKDPFWICRNQPEKYRRACYTQFLVAAMLVAHNDFVATAKFINTIREDVYAAETLAGLAVERVRLQKTDHGETIAACRSLPGRFRISCITGFAEGFLKYGPPETEYVAATQFCASPLLSPEERRPCFDRVLSILRNFYTVEKSQKICLSVDKQYQWNNCQYH